MSSLKDVARLAGVSVSTVSRVLNKSAYVEPHTVALVEDAIHKLDYRPNLLASGLKTKSSRLVGVVVPDLSLTPFISLIQHVSDYCHQLNYEVVLGSHHDNPTLEMQIIDGMLRRNVDGLLLSLVSDESMVSNMLRDTKVPVVVFDRTTRNISASSVILNNYAAGQLAAKHLAELGHTNIACITGSHAISLSRDRLKGFEDTLSEANVDLLQRNVIEGDFSYASGYDAAKYLFSSGLANAPTAIWAQSDLMALGAIQYLRTLNLRIPEDISIIGMDNISYSEMLFPQLTTIAQPFKEMAIHSFDLFHSFKKSKEHEQKVIVFEPELVVRNSTCKCK